MKSAAYKFVAFTAKHIVAIAVTGIVGVLTLNIVLPNDPTPAQVTVPQTPQKSEQEIAQSECDAGRRERLLAATQQFSKKLYDDASTTLAPCADMFTVSEKDIYVRALTLGNKARSKAAGLQAKQEKLQRKKEGVTLGMSQQDVLDSSWGRPNKVNKTTTAHGTTEQWVYGGGYLYFDNGLLKTVQH